VRYAATTNFPRGFLNPVGQPHPNADIITARDAEPTGDTRVWALQLPASKDPRFPPGTEFTFPVVARVGTMWRNFVLSIRGPRYNDRQKRCGLFWDTDQVFPGCLMPPGPPPGFDADRTPPMLKVRVPRTQRVRRLRRALAYARCNERCTVRITGRLKLGRRSYKLPSTSKAAAAGKRILLRVRLTSAAAHALTRALPPTQRATIALAARASDASKNRSRLATRTITVR
jgi:hypothetical protein